MTVEVEEEFFANGQTSANHRRDGWVALTLGVIGSIILLIIGLRAFDDLSRGTFAGTSLAVLAPVFSLYVLYRGIRSARRSFRDAAVPDGEVRWYRLDPAGLWVHHGDTWWNPVAWAAMKDVRVSRSLPAVVRVLHRPVGSIIDRTLRLRGGQKTRDGLLFEDRLPAWFGATKGASPHALPPPVAVREAGQNASAAPGVMLGPDPRPKRMIAVAAGVVLLLAALLWTFSRGENEDKTTGNATIAAKEPAEEPQKQGITPDATITEATTQTDASHRIMIESTSAATGFGFSDADGNVYGALDCSNVGESGSWDVWMLVGRVGYPRKYGSDGDYWTINDQKIAKSLKLRIDGVSIATNRPAIRGYDNGDIRVTGHVSPDRYLADLFRTAKFIELVNDDRVLSIAPSDAVARQALDQIAAACTPA